MREVTNRRLRGFTLIELLVVVAIIAVLAAILFPVFAKAREKSLQAKCLSNLRQVAVAVTMYTQDNGQTFFPDSQAHAWSEQLTAYNEASVYDCPSKDGTGTNGKPEYGFNMYLFGKATGKITNPAMTLMLVDLDMSMPQTNYAVSDFNKGVDPRHGGNANTACVDGHVKSEALLNDKKTGNIPTALQARGYDLYPAPEPLLLYDDEYVATAAANASYGGRSKYIPIPTEALKTGATIPGVCFDFDYYMMPGMGGMTHLVLFYVPANADPYPKDTQCQNMTSAEYTALRNTSAIQMSGSTFPSGKNYDVVSAAVGLNAVVIGNMTLNIPRLSLCSKDNVHFRYTLTEGKYHSLLVTDNGGTIANMAGTKDVSANMVNARYIVGFERKNGSSPASPISGAIRNLKVSLVK